jgi:hypothetical protein
MKTLRLDGFYQKQIPLIYAKQDELFSFCLTLATYMIVWWGWAVQYVKNVITKVTIISTNLVTPKACAFHV